MISVVSNKQTTNHQSNNTSTTYARHHLEAVKSFDQDKSWILSATAKPKRQPPASLDQLTNQSTNNQPSSVQPPSETTTATVKPSNTQATNPLYRTTNSTYGVGTDSAYHFTSDEWHGRPVPFSAEFAGGMFVQSGLNTGSTKSRIVGEKTELGF